MNLQKWFQRVRRVIVCFALVLLSTLATNAQSEQIFNLADFNPVGDGIADDGPALQKALDAVANAGGGKLLIPAGSYRILTPVVKDFSSVPGAKVTIQGVPSSTMPAPVTAPGEQLAAGLDLTSEIIPATGHGVTAIKLTHLDQLLIEHVGFTGTETSETDAQITLHFSDIAKATIRHCEFYGLSSIFGYMVKADRSALSIELSVFLGCTANSGAYAPIIENWDWYGFSISNTIFLDYGLRAFFGKMGLGAPLSWFNLGNAAPTTAESPRREVIVRDVFLDEGGWIGITVLPNRFALFPTPIDLIYISGLKMNVSNLGTTGHLFYDVRNIMIENSHYGWSHNSYAALHFNRIENIILDKLTCIDNADVILTDAQTQRITVINSVYETLNSSAQTTTELETSPEDDPVQYVRNQFVTTLGRPPDPAAHFYWSDLLIRCGSDNNCVSEKRSALSEYLGSQPQENFSLTGTVTDENGDPLSGATINLTGSQSSSTLSDAPGKFRFSGLPTSGIYTVAVNKRHYSFVTASQTLAHPTADSSVVFDALLNRHSIEGRIVRQDGQGMSGVTVQLAQSPANTVTTDSDGFYKFTGLEAGGTYTAVPVSNEFGFVPAELSIPDLSANTTANFLGKIKPALMLSEGSEFAIALDAVTFVSQPFSLFNSLEFSTDGFLRVMIFATNLEPITAPSQALVVAKDDEDKTYPLEVESMSAIPGQSWLIQFNVKVPANSLGGKCVQMTLTVAQVTSNNGRVCIGSVGSQSILKR